MVRETYHMKFGGVVMMASRMNCTTGTQSM